MKINQIKKSVVDFFDGSEVVYAKIDTDNHSANFYGDETICELTVDEVVSCVEMANDGWDLEEGETALEIVLADLQHDRP